MKSLRVPPVTIELAVGDIARQDDMDAVVNAANAELRIGGGVAGAIHRAAGPGLEQECRPLAPIRPGEAVITSAHRLPNRFVIHCLGPVFGQDRPEAELLGSCYREALRLADTHDVQGIAFPAISTGAFGYPLGEAADVALRAVVQEAPELKRVRRVRFVLRDAPSLETHEAALDRVKP